MLYSTNHLLRLEESEVLVDQREDMVRENQKVNRNLHALHSSKSTPLHT